MKPTFNRLSGLLSLLGLATLLIGLIIMVVLPDIRYAAWAILALGMLLMAAAVIVDFRRVSGAIGGRRGRFSTGTTVMTSIFIGITLLANAISIGNYHRFDATGLAQFTLTSQTKDVLAKLATPIRITAFFVPNDPLGVDSYIQNLLKEYQNYTTRLSVKEIDPDANPDQATKYGISMYSTVVFESDKGRRLVSPQEIVQTSTDQQGNPRVTGIEAEHAFTSAILEVTGVVQKKLYFLTGHDETSINSNYSAVTQELRNNLFKVDTLDLLVTRKVPDDAAALIIAGPQKPLSGDEIIMVESYLINGGWAMILINPDPSPDLSLLLAPWGINLASGTLIDPSSSLASSLTSTIVPRLRNVFGLTGIYFPGATALLPQSDYRPQVTPGSSNDAPVQIVWMSDNSSIGMLSLARTSENSWLERSFDPGKAPVFDQATDLKGPLDIAFLIKLLPPIDSNGKPTGAVPPTRLVIVGDSDFAANQNFYNGGNSGDNGDFFLSLVKELTAGKELISIQRKVLPFRRLIVGPDVTRFIDYSSIALLPLLVLAVGAIIWWRRR